MAEAVYVRFNDKELEFINGIVKEENITRSDAIKKLVDYASSRLKIEKAVNSYKEGRYTIRESAAIAGLRYFEFFEKLAKEGLIGTNAENTEMLIERIKRK